MYYTSLICLRWQTSFLNNGKGNRCFGHRSRWTYALTHLAMPKQRTVLFWRKHCSSLC